jgi:NuA3 HAT complex component NTO1
LRRRYSKSPPTFLPVAFRLTIDNRLDKHVFKEGLSILQDKLEQRFYTTTLAFAQDLCGVIQKGITEGPIGQSNHSRPEAIDVSPTKLGHISSEIKDRKRLGKRILKSVQKLLQVALQAEADITNRTLDVQPLLEQLEAMIDGSLKLRQPAVPVSNEEVSEDVPMPDAPEEGQIIVAHSKQGTPATDAPATDADIKDEVGEDRNGDAMDIDSEEPVADGNDQLQPPTVSPNQPEESTSHPPAGDIAQAATVTSSKPTHPRLPNGITQTSSPPHSADANSPRITAPQTQAQPLTPPRSTTNGGLSTDVLNDGGVPWYLADLQLDGTTVGEERNFADGLSEDEEELSEMDDDTLNDLGVDVNDRSIAVAADAEPVRKGRANPANFRKGTRSSARRR